LGFGQQVTFMTPALSVARNLLLSAAIAMAWSSGALAQTSAPAAAQPLSEGVAAIVNDDIISTYDMMQRMRLILATSGVQPTEDSIAAVQREALRGLIEEHLQMQELRRVEKEQKFDIVATDNDINEELDDIARGNSMSREQMLATLAGQGVGAETFRNQVRAQVSWQRWIQGRYGSRLRVGDDQVRAVQQRLAAAVSNPQFQISEVFIDSNRVGSLDEAMTGASQLVSQIQRGAPIASVARQFSASPTAAVGGDTGWVTSEELPPEVANVVETMRPGEVSGPIPVRDGVFIIQVRDRRAGAGSLLVKLKQAAISLPQDSSPAQVSAAETALAAIKGQIKGCDTLERDVRNAEGVIVSDLGEADINDLAPVFKTAAEALPINSVSSPLRTSAGVHLIVVCGKQSTGPGLPNETQIENRLYAQQLAMIARRYMRDLQSSATIESR
jgi:peptidyl-prolyl cis-trans isomerase SurA